MIYLTLSLDNNLDYKNDIPTMGYVSEDYILYYDFWTPISTQYQEYGLDFRNVPEDLMDKEEMYKDAVLQKEFKDWNAFWDWMMKEYCIEMI